MKLYLIILSFISALINFTTAQQNADLIYGYECQKSRCVKVELSEQNFEKAISLPVCRMLCGDVLGTVWPQPTGAVKTEPLMLHIDYARINFKFPQNTGASERMNQLWTNVQVRLEEQFMKKIPDLHTTKSGGHALNIQIETTTTTDKADQLPRLTLDTDESYKLVVNATDADTVQAVISAANFFGARHGLETLAQLLVYDDIRRELQLLGKVEINDAPVYKWRGFSLDTSRSWYSVEAIKRTIDAMAMVKMNTFHWHITDSHSFPMEVKSQPDLYKLGAYSAHKVYTHKDIANIVEYGRARGIRVMPEYDAPAHVGEGWQHKNMTVCFRAQPWSDYCVEPPCGQLDPTKEKLYDVLQDIYDEMNELFQPDIFHMGGDEVDVKCWNSSEHIRQYMQAKGWGLEEKDFIALWEEFQTKALERYDLISTRNGEPKKPIILWTSHLTQVPYIDEYLDKSRYIVQIWTLGNDKQVQDILKRGFQVIFSNYDALYFDCGNSAWVSDGNNWCSPYIGWQKVYDNNLQKIAGDYNSLVLGAEATVWSEEIDEQTIDARVWPRASAIAERLWSNPNGTWRQAESRMLLHRERLVENGIAAALLQPEWCLQNENECPIDAYTTSAASKN